MRGKFSPLLILTADSFLLLDHCPHFSCPPPPSKLYHCPHSCQKRQTLCLIGLQNHLVGNLDSSTHPPKTILASLLLATAARRNVQDSPKHYFQSMPACTKHFLSLPHSIQLSCPSSPGLCPPPCSSSPHNCVSHSSHPLSPAHPLPLPLPLESSHLPGHSSFKPQLRSSVHQEPFSEMLHSMCTHPRPHTDRVPGTPKVPGTFPGTAFISLYCHFLVTPLPPLLTIYWDRTVFFH